MDLTIRLGAIFDVDELTALYDDLNDYLESHINYPGWRKGVYPVRETAMEGIDAGELYVAMAEDKIAGSIILSHEPEQGYETVQWLCPSDYSKIFVLRSLVVHPDFLKCGVGKALMDFAQEQGERENMISLRLDVFEKNTPAIALYEKCGYTYLDTIDEGLSCYNLDWFKIYEKLL